MQSDHLKSKFGLNGMSDLTINTNLPDAGSVMIYDRKVPQPEFKGDFFTGVPVSRKGSFESGIQIFTLGISWDNIPGTDPSAEINFSMEE